MTTTNSPALNPGKVVDDLRNLILDAKKATPAFRCPAEINNLGMWLKAIGDVGTVSADDVILGLNAAGEPVNPLTLLQAQSDLEAAKLAVGDLSDALQTTSRELMAAETSAAAKVAQIEAMQAAHAREVADLQALIERRTAELEESQRLLAEARAAVNALPVAAPVHASAPVAEPADAFVPLAGVDMPAGITEEAAERTRHLRWAYSVVAQHPDCTTAEMAHRLNCPLYPLRMAVRALQGGNWVVSSGTRTCSVANRSANVYRVADKAKLPSPTNDLLALMEAQGEGVTDSAPAPAPAPTPAHAPAAAASSLAPVSEPAPAAPTTPVPALTPARDVARIAELATDEEMEKPKAKAKPKTDTRPTPALLPFPPPNSNPSGSLPKVAIFTDGACSGNPGPGGFAAVILYGTEGQTSALQRTITGAHPETTNNQMELIAAIAALEALKEPCEVTITTDSQYVRNGITEWIDRWKLNGWRTAAKKPVKNAELWRRLDTARQKHKTHWKWVAGHNGHPGNETADQLATAAIAALQAGTLAPTDLGSSLEDSSADADEMVATPSAGAPDAGGNDVL